MTNRIDLGDNSHYFEFVQHKDELSGGIAIHNRPDTGEQCVGGYISFTGHSWAREFDGEIETWELIQKDPLTLTPSLLCTVCGDHGFITNGLWVKA